MTEGQTDITHLETSDNPLERSEAARLLKTDAAIRRRMSGPKELGLPELLEKRRLEYGIIDDIVTRMPTYDRVFVWQLPEKKTYVPGGAIIMTDVAKRRHANEAPEGILVGAGLRALDIMKSHGYELGHKVTFVRLSPWYIQCEPLDDGTPVEFLSLRVGDLIESHDLNRSIREGKQTVLWSQLFSCHTLGNELRPLDPQTAEEY